jgi:nuclease S1
VPLISKREYFQKSSRSLALGIANVMLVILLYPVSVWGWGSDGHRIVAVIAADNLAPATQSHVANILGVPTNQVVAAMEEVAIRPDSEFRVEDRSTAPWHFIDICLKDQRMDVSARCLHGNCLTAKIDEYSKRLKEGNYDYWGADGDLAFLIHFVGDIHQPLHAANNADLGGNCVRVNSHPRAKDLHAVWDSTIARRLEESGGTIDATPHMLEQYAEEKAHDAWIPGHTEDIAWESNQIARSDIYAALQIPVEPCEPAAAICSNEPEVELSSAYMDHADMIAGHQLAKAGFRLASLLNEIWGAADSSGQWTHVSSERISTSSWTAPANPRGRFVGNRRSKIYAWPGCGTYDRMAPQNRVVFASREAAEQAGYRAALNCH